MKPVKETIWSKLNDTAANILEYVDMSVSNIELIIGEEFVTRFHIGIVTEDVVKDILWYQTTEEGKGHYSATRTGDKLSIKFLKRAF